ncbi:P-loop containing nucleoside triphosphate hydrolase protein [Apiospora arundinis]|uniref:P-loop containing nucleoside triphosphate hydrolase protein n=1 Tax=Apiospora arundinis TaxID=335852 RepID=A0ABR2IRA1_9PEZI
MEPPTIHSPTLEPGDSEVEQDTATKGMRRTDSLRQTQVPYGSTCSVTGANHANLLRFGIHVCPRCDSQISGGSTEGDEEADSEVPENETRKDLGAFQPGSSVFKPGQSDISWEILDQLKQITKDFSFIAGKWRTDSKASKQEVSGTPEDNRRQPTGAPEDKGRIDMDSDARKLDSSSTNDPMEAIKNDDDFHTKETQPSGIDHRIVFEDSGRNWLHTQPWYGPFDLETARGGVEFRGEDAIAQVLTKLRTDHQRDEKRSEDERQRIAQAGFFRNIRVDFTCLTQNIVIFSKQIIASLRRLVKYYPSVMLEGEVILLRAPYSVLFHHMAALEEYKETLSDGPQNLASTTEAQEEQLSDIQREITINHLGQLLEFTKTNMFNHQVEAERLRQTQDPPLCTFNMMWMLYTPGTTVYVRSETGKLSAYILETVDTHHGGEPNVFNRPHYHTVSLWCLSFDGFYVRRAKSLVTIGSFDGERPIMDLKIIPASFVDAEDGGKERQSLIQRGRKWYRMLVGAQQWHYTGQTLDKNMLDSRVVIDIGSYFRETDPEGNDLQECDSNSSVISPPVMDGFDFRMKDTGIGHAICPCETCRGKRPHPPKGFPWADYDLIDPEADDLQLPESYPDRDHRFLLCSGILMGFALRSRTWGEFNITQHETPTPCAPSDIVAERLDVELCKPANVNVKAIDTLVMPDDRKRMIKAIVQKHTSPASASAMPNTSTWGADFIQTKGEGQLFLLHGGPGVGKTYLTECIAELINRPLLSLTCADFGIDEESMEERLSKWFKLAEHWGAVMLLDEADVWLERRMISDLKRNTLVAVFLRCLEYYRGILFLTSNRVGTFDDAFISRIHVVIYYEDLGEPERKQIWKQFFDKLERERKDSIIVESRAKHFVLNDTEIRKIPWNGREIRNGTCSYHNRLPLFDEFYFEGGQEESDKIILDKVDFEQVCQMSLDFKEYLTKVHLGDDEKDRAMRERARA